MTDFGTWRSLANTPSDESWKALKQALLHATSTAEPEFTQEVLPYLEDQLKRWPESVPRMLTPRELEVMCSDDGDHPLWRLSQGTKRLNEGHVELIIEATQKTPLARATLDQLSLLDGGGNQGHWEHIAGQLPWEQHIHTLDIEQFFGADSLGAILGEPMNIGLEQLNARFQGYEIYTFSLWPEDHYPRLTIPALHTLSITGNALSPRGLAQLSALNMPALTQLAMPIMECGNIEAIAQASWLTQLTTLSLVTHTLADPDDDGDDITQWRQEHYDEVDEDGRVEPDHGQRAARELVSAIWACIPLQTLRLEAHDHKITAHLFGELTRQDDLLPNLERLEIIGAAAAPQASVEALQDARPSLHIKHDRRGDAALRSPHPDQTRWSWS